MPSTLKVERVPAFLKALFVMVSDPLLGHLIGWTPDGLGFVVRNVDRFAAELLPKFFKTNQFRSFCRQLNMYEFTKIGDVGEWVFSHPCFKRDQPGLLAQLKRKKPTSAGANAAAANDEDVPSSVLADVANLKLAVQELQQEHVFLKQENGGLWDMLRAQQNTTNAMQRSLEALVSGLVPLANTAVTAMGDSPTAATSSPGSPPPAVVPDGSDVAATARSLDAALASAASRLDSLAAGLGAGAAPCVGDVFGSDPGPSRKRRRVDDDVDLSDGVTLAPMAVAGPAPAVPTSAADDLAELDSWLDFVGSSPAHPSQDSSPLADMPDVSALASPTSGTAFLDELLAGDKAFDQDLVPMQDPSIHGRFGQLVQAQRKPDPLQDAPLRVQLQFNQFVQPTFQQFRFDQQVFQPQQSAPRARSGGMDPIRSQQSQKYPSHQQSQDLVEKLRGQTQQLEKSSQDLQTIIQDSCQTTRALQPHLQQYQAKFQQQLLFNIDPQKINFPLMLQGFMQLLEQLQNCVVPTISILRETTEAMPVMVAAY